MTIFLFIFLVTSHAFAGITDIMSKSDYDYENCGRTKSDTRRRFKRDDDDYNDSIQFQVMGGDPAKPGQIPFAVAIEYNKFICAGTLISRKHVATAAHCLYRGELKMNKEEGSCIVDKKELDIQEYMNEVKVRWGGECLTVGKEECKEDQVAKTVQVVKTTLFPFFQSDCLAGYDMAILELKDNVSATHVCLPHLHDTKDDTLREYFSFGWGSDPRPDLHYHKYLQKLNLGVLQEPCGEEWGNFTSDILCIEERKTKALCTGDSGSGLITDIKGRHFIFGIHSGGSTCDDLMKRKAAPAKTAFTDIRLYTATIDKELNIVFPYPEE